jgi:hypothetical protein
MTHPIRIDRYLVVFEQCILSQMISRGSLASLARILVYPVCSGYSDCISFSSNSLIN